VYDFRTGQHFTLKQIRLTREHLTVTGGHDTRVSLAALSFAKGTVKLTYEPQR
jgi:hypothetical protein